jgi:hypothetical protein
MGEREALTCIKAKTLYLLIVFRFHFLGDLNAIKADDASAFGATGIAFVLTRPHGREARANS